MTKNISTFEFFAKFPNEEIAVKYFEGIFWKEGAHCGHCGSDRVVKCKNNKPMSHRCKDCRKHFSVRTGTLLGDSRLPLQKWLLAIYMLSSARKGVPSTQMARELGITQKTAWYLSQRIREAWLTDSRTLLDGQVQVDETYIGGKEKNKHAKKKLRLGRGTAGKTAVLGVKNDKGEIRATVIENTKAETLQSFIIDSCAPGVTVVTDCHKGYLDLKDKGYTHLKVNHSVGEYVREQAHTNGIESFWALLKRGFIGIYHYMSVKHLHRYVQEFAHRHNNIKLGTMYFIENTINSMIGKKLSYKNLVLN